MNNFCRLSKRQSRSYQTERSKNVFPSTGREVEGDRIMAVKKPYAEYLRKSRADDPHESVEEVLQKHRELLNNFMEREKIYVAPEDVFEEVVSGDSLFSRPQMLRLLEAVEKGKYEAVLCMDIQRLGRGSMSDQGAMLDAFKYSGTKIITPTKTYDLSNELDETYTEFETFLGRQELRMIKKRLQRGKLKTISDGGYCANPPYGYERTYAGKTPTLRIVEEEASFVEMMYDCYANRGMGAQRIADLISSLGAKPRRGEAFARSTVLKILRNQVYLGKVVWNRDSYIRKGTRGNDKQITIHRPKDEWISVEGVHPAIISQDLFDKVQVRLAARTHKPYFTGEVANPLAGVVKCAHCGGGPLLVCLNKGCNVSSRLEYVEEAILQRLKLEAEQMGMVLKSGNTQPQTDSAEAELPLIEREIKKLQGQLGKLHDLVEQGIYDIPTFVSRRDELQSRIDTLKSRQEKLLLRKNQAVDIKKVYDAICSVLDSYPNAAPQERNRLLKSVIESVTYEKKKGSAPKEFTLGMTLWERY